MSQLTLKYLASANDIIINAVSNVVFATIGSGTHTNLNYGLAKTWARGSAPGTIDGPSFNVSSFTDDGVGLNDTNWSAAAISTNYPNHGAFLATSTVITWTRYKWWSRTAQTTSITRTETAFSRY
jgi:hypothetical protein